MIDFPKNKSKFRPTGKVTQCGYDVWNCQPIFKDEFVPTRAYMKYLAEKEQEKKDLELASLKSKLEYQQKTYGEVDPVDYASYMNMIMTHYA